MQMGLYASRVLRAPQQPTANQPARIVPKEALPRMQAQLTVATVLPVPQPRPTGRRAKLVTRASIRRLVSAVFSVEKAA